MRSAFRNGHRYNLGRARWGAALTLGLPLLGAGPAAHAGAGDAFTFGYNERGGLGLGTLSEGEAVPTAVVKDNLGDRAITDIAGGDGYSLMLADDGTVFSAGWNSRGRTGLGITEGETTIPTAMAPDHVADRRITEVSATWTHSVVLAEDGTALAFGNDSDGQTGLGRSSGWTTVATPIDTTHLGDRPITQVSAGAGFSLVVDDEGTVYSFGDNRDGQTGHGTSVGNTLVATPIDTTHIGDRAITQAAAGFSHSLLLAEDGTVFSFGTNGLGRTGLGLSVGFTREATPIDTSNLGDRSVTQVAAGGFSLLLTDDGTVFSFGGNRDGRTGLGTTDGATSVATPIDTSNLGDREIVDIAASSWHGLLLADDGSVFAFGRNSFGRTGLGITEGVTPVATAIEIGDIPPDWEVTGVDIGAWHSLVVAVPEPGSLALLGLGGLLLMRRRP